MKIYEQWLSYLNRNLVDLVQQVDARDVGSVAFDDVDQVVGGGVVTQRDVGVVDLVLRQDRFHLEDSMTQIQ